MNTPTRLRLLLAALLLALSTLACGNMSANSRTLDGIQRTVQEASR